MQFLSTSLRFRYVELIIDILNIIIYYASNTAFTITQYGLLVGLNKHQAGNTFGQFVLIVGLVLALTVILLSLTLGIDAKFPIAMVIYNAILGTVFMAAGIIIIRTWTMYDHYFVENKQTKINCGLTVGSFCIIQFLVLLVGSYFSLREAHLPEFMKFQQTRNRGVVENANAE